MERPSTKLIQEKKDWMWERQIREQGRWEEKELMMNVMDI